ncbi:hypothetical protein CRYUN_Cryun37aG0005200 [Craigia yunnanensis]
MSLDVTRKETQQPTPPSAGHNGNGVALLPSMVATHWLRLNPNTEHKPESYEGLQLEFSPLLFSSLECYLPHPMLSLSRDSKLNYMRDIILRYSPVGERTRLYLFSNRFKGVENTGKRLYHTISLCIGNCMSCMPQTSLSPHFSKQLMRVKRKILEPLHRELYVMHASNFFVPSFLKAINENKEENFRGIMAEPTLGVFTFEMLQPHFCELLLSEVENFEKWVHETKFRIMQPNTMNKFGAVLDDFGPETMLDKLMEDFIRPISKVFFFDVGGSTLDSHHGFIVEYGIDRDVELGFHVDDSEVTLNVCLGTGTEAFLWLNRSAVEILDYSHVPGRAVLHRGTIGMVQVPQHLVIGSTYFCGAEGITEEGRETCDLNSSFLQVIASEIVK